jgi:hypothetical protein
MLSKLCCKPAPACWSWRQTVTLEHMHMVGCMLPWGVCWPQRDRTLCNALSIKLGGVSICCHQRQMLPAQCKDAKHQLYKNKSLCSKQYVQYGPDSAQRQLVHSRSLSPIPLGLKKHYTLNTMTLAFLKPHLATLQECSWQSFSV